MYFSFFPFACFSTLCFCFGEPTYYFVIKMFLNVPSRTVRLVFFMGNNNK